MQCTCSHWSVKDDSITTSEGRVEEYMGDLKDNKPGLAKEDVEYISNTSTSPPLSTEIDGFTQLSSPLEVSDGKGDDSDGVVPAKYAARKNMKVASKKGTRLVKSMCRDSTYLCPQKEERGLFRASVNAVHRNPPIPYQRSARRLQ